MSAAGPLALLAVGKASSSKKVQRAAKAAASSRGTSEKRELGFPLTIAAVVILGVACIGGIVGPWTQWTQGLPGTRTTRWSRWTRCVVVVVVDVGGRFRDFVGVRGLS